MLVSGKEEYEEELRLVRKKTDTYRSKSSKSTEFESDLLRSTTTKNVAGPTESRPVDEQELRQRYQGDPILETQDASPRRDLTPGQQARADALADALAEVADVVIRELVVPLIRDVVAPAAKAKLSELAARRRIRAVERAESKTRALEAGVARLEDADKLQLAASAADLERAEPSIRITRSDLFLSRLKLKLADDYAAKQRWLISHAEVTDEDLSPALEESLTRMLEGRADELDEDEREAVAVFLQRAGSAASSKRALPPGTESDE